MVKLKDFSRPLSVFQVLFKANLIFKDFQDSPVYSRSFQACENPVSRVGPVNEREYCKKNSLQEILCKEHYQK